MEWMRSWGACIAIATSACAGGAPPEIHDLADQVAVVGTELVVTIDGSDPDGDRLTYGVHTDVSIQATAMLTQLPSGSGVFRWTPLAEDVGVHAFDFTASDYASTTTVSISIDVRSAAGAVPIFRQPLGTGTVVDLAQTPCITVDVVVDDQDTPAIAIATADPQILGGQLTAIDGTSATWKWCPTPHQVLVSDRYTLVLSADDGENPKTIKDYVLVLNSAGPHLVIDEVDYDQPGTDSAEFVEIYNPGTTSASLAGLELVLVNGATGSVYSTIDLSPGGTLPAGHYLVVAGPQVTVPGTATKLDPVWSQDQIQNGSPDGIALVDGVTHTVIDALSYEGSITSVMIAGFAAPVSFVEGTPLDPSVADSNTTAAASLCRIPNGSDTNDAATDWTLCATPTPGSANVP